MVSLIRDRFIDVIQIGRDLVRLLQNVARIPEIEQVQGVFPEPFPRGWGNYSTYNGEIICK